MTDDGQNILLLGSSDGSAENDACIDLLTITDLPDENILSVTLTQSPDQRLTIWNQYVHNSQPSQAGIISAGETARSTSHKKVSSTTSETCDIPLSVETILNPADLAALGLSINDYLSEWSANGNQTVICFHSLTALLQNADLDEVFRFLTLVTQRVRAYEAVAHYHIDPQAQSDEALFTLETLFDEVIETGTVTLEESNSDKHWHSYQISSDENHTIAVVTAVAAVKNTPPEQLDVLADIVDPDALASLFDDTSEQNRDTSLRVRFRYSGCEVVVTNQYVRVRECE